MEKSTIHQLISDRNKATEREVLRSAEEVINSIANEQERIRVSNEKIVELRKELLSLEVKQISTKDVLGEE